MLKLDTMKCVKDYCRWSTWHNNVRKKSSTLWDNTESTASSNNCSMGGKTQTGSGCGQYIIADPTTDTFTGQDQGISGDWRCNFTILSLGSSEWSSSRPGCFAFTSPSQQRRASRVHPHSHLDVWEKILFLLPQSISIVYKYLYDTAMG